MSSLNLVLTSLNLNCGLEYVESVLLIRRYP